MSRRSFLKLALLGLGGAAFLPIDHASAYHDGVDVARVAIKSVSVYSEAGDKSKILFQRYRDDLVNVYYEVTSDQGPASNPIWYRVWGGYIHRAHMQRVKTRVNNIVSEIPKKGMLVEVTVPYTQSMTFKKTEGWKLNYRLYYESVHWVMDIASGPDGEPWYMVVDELDEANMHYYAPAAHFRPITAEELEPISPDVPHHKKKIEVSILNQTLKAYEYDKVVFETQISSGLHYKPINGLKWDTPHGNFNIQNKVPSKHMGDGHMTSDLNAYELPGVPWVAFFEPDNGVAFHGTYWHDNFGNPMSHGCVNMRTAEAKWLYRWTLPVSGYDVWSKIGYGTQVIIN